MATDQSNFDVEVFYDGDCPLCVREIDMLRRWDKNERIRFTDIMAREFRADQVGVDFDTLMARIHGRLPDGTIIQGVEVFRRLYSAVGFRWPVTISRLPVIRHMLDAGYVVFAKFRLRLTGRCVDGSCAVP